MTPSLLCRFCSAVNCWGRSAHSDPGLGSALGWAARVLACPVRRGRSRAPASLQGDTAQSCAPVERSLHRKEGACGGEGGPHLPGREAPPEPCSALGQLGLQAWPEGPRSFRGAGAAEGAPGSADRGSLSSLLV